MIDALLKATHLNKSNQLAHINQWLNETWNQFASTMTTFAANVVNRFTDNISHPIEYVKQRAIELHDLAVVMTTKAVGFLIPVKQTLTTDVRGMDEYAKECAQRLGADPKDMSKTVAHIMADMAFDGGVGFCLRSGIVLTKQLPTIAAKAINAAEKTNKAVQTEKKLVAVTPEGVQVALKAEVDQAAKQGAKQAAQSAGKIEQQATKEAVKQAENVAAKEAQDLAKQTANNASKIENAAQKTERNLKNLIQKELNDIKYNPLYHDNHIVNIIPIIPGGSIKENINILNKYYKHIFSGKHIQGGILRLGKTQEEILNKFIDIILKHNNAGELVEETNTIWVVINEIKTTITVRLEKGRVINMDGYIGFSERVQGKLIIDL